MRQLAWLQTAPDKMDGDKSTTPEPSRLKRYLDDGIDPELPDCTAVYLTQYLFEIGPIINGGPISHSELFAWQANTGIDLNSWESRTLRRLSGDYAQEHFEAHDRDRQAPFSYEDIQQKRRDSVASKFKDSMRIHLASKEI